MNESRRLGQTTITLSPLGLGTWQFSQGHGLVGSFWPRLEDSLITEIVQAAWEGGMNWFDTAEIYGGGASERALARALHRLAIDPTEVRIATKWWPLGRTARSLVARLEERHQALDGYPVTLYQIHQPWSLSSRKALADGLIRLLKAQQIAAAGVSNFSAAAMIEMAHRLNDAGYPLAANQVRYNLWDRAIERNGILSAAENLGITVIAYSPLHQGLLSGKFHQPGAARPEGIRRWQMTSALVEKTRPLIHLLTEIGARYQKSPSQVALNWILGASSQVVAIPGATRPDQAAKAAEAMHFRLTPDEREALSNLSRQLSRTG